MKMIKNLAGIYGVPCSRSEVKRVVSALVGASVPASFGITVASLCKSIPIVGSVIGVVSMPLSLGAATRVVGKLFVDHFEAGGTLANFDLKTHQVQPVDARGTHSDEANTQSSDPDEDASAVAVDTAQNEADVSPAVEQSESKDASGTSALEVQSSGEGDSPETPVDTQVTTRAENRSDEAPVVSRNEPAEVDSQDVSTQTSLSPGDSQEVQKPKKDDTSPADSPVQANSSARVDAHEHPEEARPCPPNGADTPDKPDKLTRVAGIGPKIAELLAAEGIVTYAGLASTSVETLLKILDRAGTHYRRYDPASWPQQAQTLLASRRKT